MLNHRSSLARHAVASAFLVGMLALASAAKAGVRVGIGVNIALPPHLNVSVGNYEPYYLGRVFYQPLGVWRPVYSFPVHTPYGVEYSPYVYDRGRVVCHDYIPGHEAGYGQFVLEGRGHYNPRWFANREHHAYHRYNAHHDHGWHGGKQAHAKKRGHWKHQQREGSGARHNDRHRR